MCGVVIFVFQGMNRVGRQFWWDTPQIYDAIVPAGSPANIATLVSVWRVRIQYIASSMYIELVYFFLIFYFVCMTIRN